MKPHTKDNVSENDKNEKKEENQTKRDVDERNSMMKDNLTEQIKNKGTKKRKTK